MIIKFNSSVKIKNNIVESPDVRLKIKTCLSSIQKALSALILGAEEDEIIDDITSDDELAYLFYCIELFKRHGLLTYETGLIKCEPFNGEFSFKNRSEGKFQLSRFVLCRPLNGEFIIETPLSPIRMYIKDLEGFRFLSAFKKPLTLEEVMKAFSNLGEMDVKSTFSLLYSANILTAKEESAPSLQWDFYDLFFHSRCRLGRHDAPLGGTFRFRGKIPSLPSVKPCSGNPLISLVKPVEELSLSLEQTIEKRESIREHGATPISIEQIGEFLYRCARIKQVNPYHDDEISFRPYPGGGARYELELYLVVFKCEGLEQGVYHYHPLEHQLCKVRNLDNEAEVLLQNAMQASMKKEYPQVLIILGARFQRVSWKYESMAYSVILKNVGVLLQTMYLVATAMELAPCALGSGNSDLFCDVMETDYLVESSVGEFMLGSRPR